MNCLVSQSGNILKLCACLAVESGGFSQFNAECVSAKALLPFMPAVHVPRCRERRLGGSRVLRNGR